MGRIAIFFTFLFFFNATKAASQQLLKPANDSMAKHISIKVLPQNFYNRHLGFTCKKEYQLQKLISLPIYIRLGPKDYVDYLEKKPNAILNKQ